MKKFSLIIIMLSCTYSFKLQSQHFNYQNAVKFANSNYNQGVHVQSMIDVHLISRNTDPVDMGISVPLIVNTGPVESPVWSKMDHDLTNTSCAGFLGGTDNVYVFDSDVNTNGFTALCGRFTGIITVNGVNDTCGGTGPCGFAAVVDSLCNVTEFAKFESTSGTGVTRIVWSANEMLLGINFKGTMTAWGNTFTSAGNDDAVLAKTTSLLNPAATFSSFAGPGTELVQSIDPDGSDIMLSLYIGPPMANTVTYNYPGGTQSIPKSTHTNTNALINLDAQLGYQSHEVIGSNSGVYDILRRIRYASNGGFAVAGTLSYGELFPDPANQSTSISQTGIQSMVMVNYDQNMNYQKSWFNPIQSIIRSCKRDTSFIAKPLLLVTGQILRPNAVMNDQQKSSLIDADHGIVYVFDDALSVTDSMIIGAPPGGDGFCQFWDSDVDATGSLYVTGFFNDSIDLDPDPTSQAILTGNSGAWGDIVLAKYDVTSLGVNENEMTADDMIKVYPNPFASTLNISFNGNRTGNHDIFIRDLAGRVVAKRTLDVQTGMKLSLDLNSVSPGVYLVEVVSGKGREVRRVVRL